MGTDRGPTMRKETFRQPKPERASRPKFTPCERDEKGGIVRGGAQCSGGLWIYWATAHDATGKDIYGKPVRWAKTCSCMHRWRSGAAAQPHERARADLA